MRQTDDSSGRSGRRLAVALSAVVWAACAPSPTAPEPTAPIVAAGGTMSARASSPAPPVPSGRESATPHFEKLWEAKSLGWNHAVALLGSGDVVEVAARTLAVRARHSGVVLEQRDTCHALRSEALDFVSPTTAVVVCDQEIRTVDFPGLAQITVASLPWQVESTALGGGRLAVASDRGELRYYDVPSFALSGEIVLGKKVASLALSPDGRWLAVGYDDGTITLRDTGDGGEERALHQAGESSVDALAFSPDGGELFGDTKSFEAGAIDVATGRVLRGYPISSWLEAARYLGPDLVAATGAHGLSLLARDGSATLLDSTLGEGLGVSADGTLVCAGDRHDRIACFGSVRPAPSDYRPAPPAAPGDTGRPVAVVGTGAVEVAGRIEARVGATLVCSLDEPVQVGAHGTMSKRFSHQIGPLSMTGWLEIAEVTVTKVEGRRVSFRLDAEKGEITLNGRRLNHYAGGAEIKVALAGR